MAEQVVKAIQNKLEDVVFLDDFVAVRVLLVGLAAGVSELDFDPG